MTYDLSALPPTLLRNFSVLRRKLERAGFTIEVVLRPLTQLPPDAEVLFVPTELVEVARQAAPEAHVMTITLTEAHPPAFNELVQQLNSGQELYALRVAEESEGPEAPRRVIARYRGRERLY